MKRLAIIFIFSVQIFLLKAAILPDSIATQYLDGKKYLMHQVEPKETFYSIARKYNLSPSILISNNIEDSVLKIGTVVKVPFEYMGVKTPYVKPTSNTSTGTTMGPKPFTNTTNTSSNTKKHTVIAKETLYSVSKKYGMTIERIKQLNNLKDNGLSIGQTLMVENAYSKPSTTNNNTTSTNVLKQNPSNTTNNTTTTTVVKQNPTTNNTNTPTTNTTTVTSPTTRQIAGVKEMNESGIGIAIGDESIDPNKSLALHKTAPIGTIIKVQYPLNDKKVYVKVIGRMPNTPENETLVIILSKTASELLGILDEKFQVSLTYGVPQ